MIIEFTMMETDLLNPVISTNPLRVKQQRLAMSTALYELPITAFLEGYRGTTAHRLDLVSKD